MTQTEEPDNFHCRQLLCRDGVKQEEIVPETIEHLVRENRDTLDSRFPAIMTVLSGTVSPKEAIKQLHDDKEPEEDSEPTEVNPQPPIRRPFGDRFSRIPGVSDN